MCRASPVNQNKGCWVAVLLIEPYRGFGGSGCSQGTKWTNMSLGEPWCRYDGCIHKVRTRWKHIFNDPCVPFEVYLKPNISQKVLTVENTGYETKKMTRWIEKRIVSNIYLRVIWEDIKKEYDPFVPLGVFVQTLAAPICPSTLWMLLWVSYMYLPLDAYFIGKKIIGLKNSRLKF